MRHHPCRPGWEPESPHPSQRTDLVPSCSSRPPASNAGPLRSPERTSRARARRLRCARPRPDRGRPWRAERRRPRPACQSSSSRLTASAAVGATTTVRSRPTVAALPGHGRVTLIGSEQHRAEPLDEGGQRRATRLARGRAGATGSSTTWRHGAPRRPRAHGARWSTPEFGAVDDGDRRPGGRIGGPGRAAGAARRLRSAAVVVTTATRCPDTAPRSRGGEEHVGRSDQRGRLQNVDDGAARREPDDSRVLCGGQVGPAAEGVGDHPGRGDPGRATGGGSDNVALEFPDPRCGPAPPDANGAGQETVGLALEAGGGCAAHRCGGQHGDQLDRLKLDRAVVNSRSTSLGPGPRSVEDRPTGGRPRPG